MSRSSELKSMRNDLASFAFMTVSDVAGVLGCSYKTASKMVNEGLIPTVTVGRERKVSPVDLVMYLAAQREGMDTVQEYQVRHGDQAVDRAMSYYGQIRKYLTRVA